MKPWLSIVLPTIGRPSLVHTLDAIDAQPVGLLDGVEVLVVADTHGGRSVQLEQVHEHLTTERTLGRYRYLECDGGQHCYGQPQRTYGGQQARGDWVWFGQDDNIASAEALRAIHDAVQQPDVPGLLVFRIRTYWGDVVWHQPVIQPGNIDADCLVMRREIAAAVTWGLRYEGDYDAAKEASALSGSIGWIDQLVSIARPNAAHHWWVPTVVSYV